MSLQRQRAPEERARPHSSPFTRQTIPRSGSVPTSAAVTMQGPRALQKSLPLAGPSQADISLAWTSRAEKSLKTVKPKTWSPARSDGRSRPPRPTIIAIARAFAGIRPARPPLLDQKDRRAGRGCGRSGGAVDGPPRLRQVDHRFTGRGSAEPGAAARGRRRIPVEAHPTRP